MPHHASTQIKPYAGEFERRRPASQRRDWGSERCALVGFPDGLAHQDNPQIRVMPSLEKLQPTSSYNLPIRLLQQLIDH